MIVNKAENQRQTVIQYAHESGQAEVYRQLAQKIVANDELDVPTPMTFEELENLVAAYGD